MHGIASPMMIRASATFRARTVASAIPGSPLGAVTPPPVRGARWCSLTGGVHQITRPRLPVHARDWTSPQQQSVDTPLVPEHADVAFRLRPFDVFLCHSGCTHGDVPLLLDHVSTALQQSPSIEGAAVKCVFWHGEDVDGLRARIVHAQNLWQAAISLIPIGAHKGPHCCSLIRLRSLHAHSSRTI